MRKTLLTLLAVMFSLSSAYAADITEDWTTKDKFGPTSNSVMTATKGTSTATNIEYTCKSSKSSFHFHFHEILYDPCSQKRLIYRIRSSDQLF